MTRNVRVQVAIVGGRATGAAAAVHLASRVPNGSTVYLIDPDQAGYPAVFDDPDPALTTNTSAEIMSINPEHPDDVLKFLGQRDRYQVPPRAAIGAYCRERVRQATEAAAARDVTVQRIRAKVDAITRVAGGYALGLDDYTRTLNVSHAVVALGPARARPHDIGMHPYPASRLRAAAQPHVLVRGQGQSGIEASLILASMGSAVTMASRTGLLPAVRTHTFAIPLACELAPPVNFRQAIDQHLRNNGLPTLSRQIVEHPDPVRRLQQEILLAMEGQSWTDPIVGLIDAVVRHAWPVTEDRHFLWRYVTAMHIDTARQLANHLSTGQITVAAPHRQPDPRRFGLVVNATGVTSAPLTGQGRTLYISGHGSQRHQVRISANLRIILPGSTRPERIWAIGPTSGPKVRFSNFLRAAVIQSQSIADQIIGDHRI